MPIPRFTVACTSLREIARNIYEVRFTKPLDFDFRPGQFLLFDVPTLEDENDLQPRAYSIASTPDEPELLFVLKYIDGGRTSEWVKHRLKRDTLVSMQGPLGMFGLKPDDRELLFVCTSTGIAPFRSMIRRALAEGDSRRMDLVFGVFSEEDLFWSEEWEELARTHENFFLHLALSNPSDSWTGHRGWVQSLVPLIARDMSRKHVYVCGNPNMTLDLKKLCVEEWGLTKKDVHIEGYV